MGFDLQPVLLVFGTGVLLILLVIWLIDGHPFPEAPYLWVWKEVTFISYICSTVQF